MDLELGRPVETRCLAQYCVNHGVALRDGVIAVRRGISRVDIFAPTADRSVVVAKPHLRIKSFSAPAPMQ